MFELETLTTSQSWLKQKGLSYHEDRLYSGHTNLETIAETFGTPLYVSNADIISRRYTNLHAAFTAEYPRTRIHYAVKANTNISILKLFHHLGASVECVSPGEVGQCLAAGFSPDQILYTGNNWSEADLEYAIRHQVMITLDAPSQLDRLVSKLSESQSQSQAYPLIAFRVNPEFGAGHHDHCITAGKDIKFGLFEDQVLAVYRRAQEYGFTKFGIHMHIGSGILDQKPFAKSMAKFQEIITELTETLEITFEFIDIGGGFGIPYRPDQTSLPILNVARTITTQFKQMCHELDLGTPLLQIEPGRFLIAESTVLLTQITTIKDNGYKTFIGVDAGFNTLIRPAFYDSYHAIIPTYLCPEEPEKPLHDLSNVDVVGPLCESGDYLGKNRNFGTNIQEADYLAILDAGAYGFTMSSHYNSRLKPAEVLISESFSPQLIRKRETFADLIEQQVILDGAIFSTLKKTPRQSKDYIMEDNR